MSNALTSQEFWERQYQNVLPGRLKNSHPLSRLVREHIPRGSGDCIEIGCFPGSFLPMFGELGYTVNGIDIVPRVATLPRWLAGSGYRTGTFYEGDFLGFDPGKKFAVVCSFGFIEHFNNWEDVMKRHLALVGDDGYLVITTPNFKGRLQNVFHRLLDRESYDKHNIRSMDPERWAGILKANGFSVVYSGYFGGLRLWIDKGLDRRLRTLMRILLMPVNCLGAHAPDSKSYSAFCGIVAKRETPR